MMMNLKLDPTYSIAFFNQDLTEFIGYQQKIGKSLGRPIYTSNPNNALQLSLNEINEEIEYMKSHKEFNDVKWLIYEVCHQMQLSEF